MLRAGSLLALATVALMFEAVGRAWNMGQPTAVVPRVAVTKRGVVLHGDIGDERGARALIGVTAGVIAVVLAAASAELAHPVVVAPTAAASLLFAAGLAGADRWLHVADGGGG